MTSPADPARDPATEQSSKRPSTPRSEEPLRGSRTSGAWLAVVALVVVLVLLAVFILQNTRRAHVSFLGWDGNPPLAVLLLIAAAAGLAVAVIAGGLRILQLRRRVKKDARRSRETA